MSGFGLAVVARIVEQLGGQLRVDSEVDQGSKFSFLIPLSLHVEGSKFPTNSRRTSRSSGSLRLAPSDPLPESVFPGQNLDQSVNAFSSKPISQSSRNSVRDEEREVTEDSSTRPNTRERQPSFQGVFGGSITQKSQHPSEVGLAIERRSSGTSNSHSNVIPPSRLGNHDPPDHCRLKVLVVEVKSLLAFFPVTTLIIESD